jgi:hypothetical protein
MHFQRVRDARVPRAISPLIPVSYLVIYYGAVLLNTFFLQSTYTAYVAAPRLDGMYAVI